MKKYHRPSNKQRVARTRNFQKFQLASMKSSLSGINSDWRNIKHLVAVSPDYLNELQKLREAEQLIRHVLGSWDEVTAECIAVTTNEEK